MRVLVARGAWGAHEMHTRSVAAGRVSGEREHTERAALEFQTHHRPIVFESGHDPTALLPRIWGQFDEPILSPNTYSKYFLSEAAADAGILGCLSGLGAEALAVRTPDKIMKKTRKHIGEDASLREMLLYDQQHLFSPEEIGGLLVDSSIDPRAVGLEVVGRYRDAIDSDDEVDVFDGVTALNLDAEKSVAMQDRTGAMNGVEIRHPFRDASLFQLARTIPGRHKLGEDGEAKAILKAAFRDVLPEFISRRPVIGYPSYYWDNGEVEALKRKLLSPEGLERTGLLRPDAVETILAADRVSTKKSRGKPTWGLLVLQAWYELHINENQAFFDTAESDTPAIAAGFGR